ncbi:MAG TPA: hypothetical protein VJR71_13210 [Pseudolabrys sp.]|nr:hypothetical protein [Pseudolabrys sp.]
MKLRRLAALTFVAAAFATGQPHAEDAYVRKVPLDAFTVPVPLVPPGSSLDLRPGRAPDASDQINGYTPLTKDSTTPSIGLSIKSPFEDRK